MQDTVKLYHRKYGAGPPLTILHGLFGAGGNWHTLSKNVFGAFRTVIVADLRNHGKSPHDPRLDYRVMVQDVLELWKSLGIETSDLLGHSMGGKVAMQVALDAPGRVSKLVVADIVPRPYKRRHDTILRALMETDPRKFGTRSDVDEALAAYIPDFSVRQFLLKNLRRGSDGTFGWLVNLEAIRDNYQHISAGLDAYETYEGPSLFVRGAKSSYVRDEDLEVIRAYFPEAEVETIEDAGHWLHAEAPQEFAERVSRFLNRPGNSSL